MAGVALRARGLSALSLVVAFVAVGASAHADVTKPQCIDANTQAQSLRREGKLAAARAQLRTCSDAACPQMVRADCVQRLDELERAQPTILFDAKDAQGHDLFAVEVTIDGRPFADRLEGKALPVDPGVHAFTFAVAGSAPVTRTFVLKEGEKERREPIVLGEAAAPAAGAAGSTSSSTATTAALPSTPPDTTPPRGLGTQRLLGLVAGGAGVVGLGVGAAFGLMASAAWSNAKSACGGDTSRCTNVGSATSYRSTTETDGTISTVAFVAGGVLLAGGAVLFFTGGRAEPSSAPTAGVAVVPTFGPGQAGVGLTGTFR